MKNLIFIIAMILAPMIAYAAPFEFFETIIRDREVSAHVLNLETQGITDVADIVDTNTVYADGSRDFDIHFRQNSEGHSAIIHVRAGVTNLKSGRVEVITVTTTVF